MYLQNILTIEQQMKNTLKDSIIPHEGVRIRLTIVSLTHQLTASILTWLNALKLFASFLNQFSVVCVRENTIKLTKNVSDCIVPSCNTGYGNLKWCNIQKKWHLFCPQSVCILCLLYGWHSFLRLVHSYLTKQDIDKWFIKKLFVFKCPVTRCLVYHRL